MGENLFILGAGASAESGAPLMGNFLDIAEDLLRAGEVEEKNEFSKVFEVISRLQNVFAKSNLNLDNIEAIFGAIEMARIIKKLDSYSVAEIEEIRNALVILIVNTLERKINYPVANRQVFPTDSYKQFVDLLKDKNMKDVSIITFNYDVALDYALYRHGEHVNYCLDESSSRGIKLLKLHGSVNWARCNECSRIIPFDLEKYFSKFHWDIFSEETKVRLSMSKDLEHLRGFHEHSNFDKIPVLVPPTWNKTEYHGNLTNVWNHAAYELSCARNIYVFGYSLPETDSFFRYLFALGTIGDSRIRRFWVFDPDNSGLVQKRYEALLGRGIISRFEYNPLRFSDAVRELRKRVIK